MEDLDDMKAEVMAMKSPSEALLDVQEHCSRLSRALAKLWQHDPVTVVKDNEILEYGDAAATPDSRRRSLHGVCRACAFLSPFDFRSEYIDPHGWGSSRQPARPRIPCRRPKIHPLAPFEAGA